MNPTMHFILHLESILINTTNIQRLASVVSKPPPALRGSRALAREAHRADSRRAPKKICVNQNNLDNCP